MGMKRTKFLSLPILAVISLMAFVYYVTVFVFLEGWLGLGTSQGVLNAAILSFSALMALLSFFAAALTDPGGVASSFAPETEDPQRNQGTQSRYCDKCCTYKPPRTHHCRVCKRCVLKMVLCGTIIVALSLSTSTLLGWHIYLLTHNMSTIEYREAVRAMWLARKSGQKYRHPYDLGAYNNLVVILGPNILKWLCPLAVGHLNDGTQFPISNE